MEATLEAVKRNTFGNNEAGRLRRAGQIPAVLYGGESREGVSLAVDPKALSKILHSKSGANTLISLKLEGAGDTRVLVKEYQIDPVGHRLLHADFYKVAMDKALRVTVQVHLTGEAKGVKQPVREVLNLILGTATYLVSKGPVIKDGDTIEVKEKSKQLNTVLEASALPERDVPDYIEVDHKAMKGKFVRKPALEDVPFPVQMEPNLVVEFYSR